MQIVLISGFLGSGKTTFLQHLALEIQAQKLHKIALVINEFADIALDALPFSESFTTKAITHGSIFCTCKTGEFFANIHQLALDGFDYALVEASGFANLKGLQAVVDTLAKQLELVWLDRIVLVDAAKILKWLRVAVNAQNQIEMATIVIINKIDLVSSEQLTEVKRTITQLNPQAKIFCTTYGKVNLTSCLLPAPLTTDKPLWLTKNLREAFLTLSIKQNISIERLEAALTSLDNKIFRAKGFVVAHDQTCYIDYSSRYVVTPVSHTENLGKLVILYDISLIGTKEILEVLGEFLVEADKY
ncbi:MAG: hypothetical protein LBC84_02435 [Prevotellaceae bacterium]|jgi:G3E family GTPase|nr:hypothetical protein [Prevotellaceae bacterium]